MENRVLNFPVSEKRLNKAGTPFAESQREERKTGELFFADNPGTALFEGVEPDMVVSRLLLIMDFVSFGFRQMAVFRVFSVSYCNMSVTVSCLEGI
jgi:hypothetical protein